MQRQITIKTTESDRNRTLNKLLFIITQIIIFAFISAITGQITLSFENSDFEVKCMTSQNKCVQKTTNT